MAERLVASWEPQKAASMADPKVDLKDSCWAVERAEKTVEWKASKWAAH